LEFLARVIILNQISSVHRHVCISTNLNICVYMCTAHMCIYGYCTYVYIWVLHICVYMGTAHMCTYLLILIYRYIFISHEDPIRQGSPPPCPSCFVFYWSLFLLIKETAEGGSFWIVCRKRICQAEFLSNFFPRNLEKKPPHTHIHAIFDFCKVCGWVGGL